MIMKLVATVFLSFVLGNLIVTTKHNGKVDTFTFLIELFKFHSSRSVKLKTRFPRKGNLKKCPSFEEQNGTRYILGNIYFEIIVVSCLLFTKPCLRFIIICFARQKKGFYQISWGNEVDFTYFADMIKVFPKISPQNQNFKKLRHSFVDEKAMTIISSCHWKTLLPFSTFVLAKKKTWKRIFTTNSKLSQNHAEKQFLRSKTTLNWLFNDI